MAILQWPMAELGGGPIHPERYLPARDYVQIEGQGFSAVRPPVITRYSLWRQTLVYPNMSHGDRQRVEGFIDRMRGSSEVARIAWGYYQVQSGGGSGTPSVSGAHNAGVTTVLTTGWSGTSPYLRSRADMVQFEYTIGGVVVPTLHRCTSDTTSGDLNLRIWPPVRFDLVNTQPVYFLNRLPPGANTGTGYLECAMSYVDPSALEPDVFPSSPGEHYGSPGSHTFREAVQAVY